MESNNNLIIEIESQIRNNEFKSKEELTEYLKKLISSDILIRNKKKNK